MALTIVAFAGSADGRFFPAGIAQDVVTVPLSLGANIISFRLNAGQTDFTESFTIFRVASLAPPRFIGLQNDDSTYADKHRRRCAFPSDSSTPKTASAPRRFHSSQDCGLRNRSYGFDRIRRDSAPEPGGVVPEPRSLVSTLFTDPEFDFVRALIAGRLKPYLSEILIWGQVDRTPHLYIDAPGYGYDDLSDRGSGGPDPKWRDMQVPLVAFDRPSHPERDPYYDRPGQAQSYCGHMSEEGCLRLCEVTGDTRLCGILREKL